VKQWSFYFERPRPLLYPPLCIRRAKQVGGIRRVPLELDRSNSFLVHFCCVPLHYKKETSRPEGERNLHNTRNHHSHAQSRAVTVAILVRIHHPHNLSLISVLSFQIPMKKRVLLVRPTNPTNRDLVDHHISVLVHRQLHTTLFGF
jgi:hypothetical protein